MENGQHRIEQIETEYFHLQSIVDSFDSKSLTIKAWSVSVAGAIAGTSALTQNKSVLLFASLVSLMFWIIDGAWKNFQLANYLRISEIEKFMRNADSSIQIVPFQITDFWHKSYAEGGKTRLLKQMFWPHVILPHGAMCFLLIVIYFVLS